MKIDVFEDSGLVAFMLTVSALIIFIFAFIIGYDIGEVKGYYKGKNEIYEKMLKRELNETNN